MAAATVPLPRALWQNARMFRPLPIALGLRYTRAKRRNGFISFISGVSMLGLALGIAALIVVISVMNGFERELRERILGMASHATISEIGGRLEDWERLVPAVERADPRILGLAPFVGGEAMLSAGGQVSGALVRGILPARERTVSEIETHLRGASLDVLEPGAYRIVLGAELAAALRVFPGDTVLVMAPQASTTVAGIVPRMRRFQVADVFEVGMYEYDRAAAFIHLADAQALFRTGDAVTGLRLRLDDLMAAPVVSRQIAQQLPGLYRVSDWTRENANLFRAIQMERIVMFIILSLIVGVAAFNIVSTLVMLVTDKRPDIAILRTLGLSPGEVMTVFIVQGTVIGLIGIALGLLGGLSLAFNIEVVVPAIERMTGVEFLSADVYYINELPSEVRFDDVVRIVTLGFVLTVLATLFPAWRAARTQPAEALRDE